MSTEAAALIEQWDDAREHLARVVRQHLDLALAVQPKAGTWSVVDNLRHLLFAEQAHIGHLLSVPPAFSPLGLPPPGMMGNKRIGKAGTEPSDDAVAILAAWDAAHREIQGSLPLDDPKFAPRLEKHLKHLQLHTTLIERQLRKAQRPAG